MKTWIGVAAGLLLASASPSFAMCNDCYDGYATQEYAASTYYRPAAAYGYGTQGCSDCAENRYVTPVWGHGHHGHGHGYGYGYRRPYYGGYGGYGYRGYGYGGYRGGYGYRGCY